MNKIEQSMEQCRICPRNCGVDRFHGQTGYCMTDSSVKIGRAALHFWEEPCICGDRGAGAIFFSGCNMRCCFCQNHKISNGAIGRDISVEQLAQTIIELQEQNAYCIDLVTPTHYALQIRDALVLANKKGLRIPVVYNTSGYESVSTLRELEGLVQIYMPDFKFWDQGIAAKYANAFDYPQRARDAIHEMYGQTGPVQMGEDGMMKSGVLVRHLELPGLVKDSKRIVEYLLSTYGDKICLSLMNQYTPVVQSSTYPELNRTVTKREYESLISYAIDLGMENGFIQEGGTCKESFIPEFGEGEKE